MALLLFPDGHLPDLWRRVVAGVAVAEGVLFAAEVGGDPAAFPGLPLRWLVIPNHAELSWLWTVSELVNGVVYLACLASLVVRYQRGDEMLRRQLLWLALALIAMLVAFVVWVPSVEAGPLVLILLVVPLVPAAITIAVLRYQLLDIRLVAVTVPRVIRMKASERGVGMSGTAGHTVCAQCRTSLTPMKPRITARPWLRCLRRRSALRSTK